MSTIRGRAIELASDPANFEPGATVPFFDSPGEAKLEADARLAICIDQITDELVDSASHRTRFSEAFDFQLREIYPSPEKNRRLDPQIVAGVFQIAFLEVYDDDVVKKRTFATHFGSNAVAACLRYVSAVEEHGLSLDEYVGYNQQLNLYRKPYRLLRAGNATFAQFARGIILGLHQSNLKPEECEQFLNLAVKDIRSVASLSLFQAEKRGIRTPFFSTTDTETMAMQNGVRQDRGLPLHASPQQAAIRPHRGCPAMPELPAVGILHGGSALGKLWGMTAELILNTNLHALGDNRKEYRILKPVVPTTA